MDPARPRADWVAVAGQRIVAVGSGPPGWRVREVADLRRAACPVFTTRTTTWPGSA